MFQEEKIYIELKSDLKKTIIFAREKIGLTQSDLARQANMTQPEVARLEKEMNNPKINTLLKILIPLGYKLTIVADNTER